MEKYEPAVETEELLMEDVCSCCTPRLVVVATGDLVQLLPVGTNFGDDKAIFDSPNGTLLLMELNRLSTLGFASVTLLVGVL